MDEKYFQFKNYPDDIYRAVGELIRWAQEWEEQFKQLAKLFRIRKINIDNASLNVLNQALKKALKKRKDISEEEREQMEEDCNKLEKIIGARNYINHTFFLTDFREVEGYDSYDQKIEALETKLNFTRFIIFEATDYINNVIGKLNGDNIMRSTIFDGPRNAEQ